ncbi:hypothetical protein C8J57DRAFT_1459136 [Mycena rebaudengoi]|nr:hypothetical protein C8J57DRAFT_1459136 [Mycena rebaudengoi]
MSLADKKHTKSEYSLEYNSTIGWLRSLLQRSLRSEELFRYPLSTGQLREKKNQSEGRECEWVTMAVMGLLNLCRGKPKPVVTRSPDRRISSASRPGRRSVIWEDNPSETGLKRLCASQVAMIERGKRWWRYINAYARISKYGGPAEAVTVHHINCPPPRSPFSSIRPPSRPSLPQPRSSKAPGSSTTTSRTRRQYASHSRYARPHHDLARPIDAYTRTVAPRIGCWVRGAVHDVLGMLPRDVVDAGFLRVHRQPQKSRGWLCREVAAENGGLALGNNEKEAGAGRKGKEILSG